MWPSKSSNASYRDSAIDTSLNCALSSSGKKQGSPDPPTPACSLLREPMPAKEKMRVLFSCWFESDVSAPRIRTILQILFALQFPIIHSMLQRLIDAVLLSGGALINLP